MIMDNTRQLNRPIHLLIVDSSRQKVFLFAKRIKMLKKLRAEPKTEWRNIRCMMTKGDVSEYFAAARIMIRDIYGVAMNYFYDEFTFESELFMQMLGILNEKTIEFVNNSDQIVFIIEWNDIFETNSQMIDTRNQLKWFDLSDFAKDQSISSQTVCLVQKYQQRFSLQKQQLNQYFVFDVEPELLFQNFYGSLYQSKFRKENENWKVFKIFENQFPSIKELEKCKAIVISGSKLDVDGNQDYLKKLCELIRTIFDLQGMPKIVGICFGHQIVAYALGATVGPIEDLQKKSDYLCFLNNQNIKVNHSFLQQEYLKNSSANIDFQKGLNISQAHGYEIKKLPFFINNYGDSQNCQHEIIGIPGKFLGFQGHPEFNASFVETKIFQEITHFFSFLKKERTDQLVSEYLQNELDNNTIIQLLRDFMDS